MSDYDRVHLLLLVFALGCVALGFAANRRSSSSRGSARLLRAGSAMFGLAAVIAAAKLDRLASQFLAGFFVSRGLSFAFLEVSVRSRSFPR
jgi:hypothetical protein